MAEQKEQTFNDGVFEKYREIVNPQVRAARLKAESAALEERGGIRAAAKATAGAMFGLLPMDEPAPVKAEVDPEPSPQELVAAIRFAEAAQVPPDDGAPLYFADGVAVYGDEDELEEDWA